MSDPLLDEVMVLAREGEGTAKALIMKLESLDSAMRAAKCTTEQLRQFANATERVRATRLFLQRLAERIAEGGA